MVYVCLLDRVDIPDIYPHRLLVLCMDNHCPHYPGMYGFCTLFYTHVSGYTCVLTYMTS